MRFDRSSLAALARLAALSAFAAGLISPAFAASPTPAANRSGAVRAPDQPAPRAGEADDPPRNVVARARMLECGHQWNSQKKNGTASGTWKDFSRGCLAQR